MSDIKYVGTDANLLYGRSNDISFGGNNDIMVTDGKEYAKQKIVKILLSLFGDNMYYPNYGTDLGRLTFSDIQDPLIQNRIADEILRGLIYLESMETSTQTNEKIATINNIELIPDVANTTLYIKLEITLQNGEDVTITLGQ